MAMLYLGKNCFGQDLVIDVENTNKLIITQSNKRYEVWDNDGKVVAEVQFNKGVEVNLMRSYQGVKLKAYYEDSQQWEATTPLYLFDCLNK